MGDSVTGGEDGGVEGGGFKGVGFGRDTGHFGGERRIEVRTGFGGESSVKSFKELPMDAGGWVNAVLLCVRYPGLRIMLKSSGKRDLLMSEGMRMMLWVSTPAGTSRKVVGARR